MSIFVQTALDEFHWYRNNLEKQQRSPGLPSGPMMTKKYIAPHIVSHAALPHGPVPERA